MLNQLQRGDEPALLPCRRSGFLRRPEVDMIKKRRLSWQRRPLIIDLWVVTFNQINQRFPGHHLLHLGQKALASGALLSRGLLVIAKSELLAAHEPSPRLRLHGNFRADGLGFPGSPQAS